MDRLGDILDVLAAGPCCGYRQGGAAHTEPTALAAMALVRHRRAGAAAAALEWLARLQDATGSVGIRADQPAPGWPTGLAVLAWTAASQGNGANDPVQGPRIRKGLRWILDSAGESLPRIAQAGHDASLVGWSWVAGTHSWVEPTAIQVLALKAAGRGSHPRTRQGVALLADRLLPGGGANFGNVSVFGHELRPQAMPTGVALLALAGEKVPNGRLERAIEYLERTLSAQTSTVSLCYGLMGLAAHGRSPAEAPAWLEAAARRTMHERAPFKAALLALAADGGQAFRPSGTSATDNKVAEFVRIPTSMIAVTTGAG